MHTHTIEAAQTMAPAGPKAGSYGWRVLAVLSALMGFGSISTDLYLPAMPAIGQALGTSAGAVEWTISGYLIGFSLGQLLWGPISDRFGRKVPVAIGLVLFALGSAGCALAGSVWALVGCRIVQAIGACAGVVLARAMVRDLYEGDRAARMLSTLMTIMAVAPLLGPIVGGQILALAGWRWIFWTLVCVGLLTLAALFTLPETLRAENRNHEPLGRAVARYGALLRQRQLLGYAVSGGFFYGGIFAYIAGTPFAFISYYHVQPQAYGFLFAIGIAGIMLANLLNRSLVTRFGSDRLLRAGAAGAALTGAVAALDARFGWGGLIGLVMPLLLYVSMSGLIVANSVAGALAAFPGQAGTVSALVGATHYGAGVLGAAMVGWFAEGTPWPMGWVIGLSGIGSFVVAMLLVRLPDRSW